MASLIAIGLQPGDEVLVPGYTFVATFSAVIAVGGKPVMVEIDESLTMDVEDARKKITLGPRQFFLCICWAIPATWKPSVLWQKNTIYSS